MLKIAYSPIYKYQLPEGHRFPMMKYELIPAQLLYEGTISEENFFHPDALPEEVILWTHTAEYWNKLKTLSLSAREIRKIGFPLREDLIKRGRHISQGTIDCCHYALKYGVSMNVAGGTHHAFKDRGEGFCLLNDFAIAANYLLKKNIVQQILIVDLDVHQGNGTANIFENESRVFTFSMHGEKNYPTQKEKSDLDIGLPDKCEDELFLSTLKNTLPKLINDVQPDLIMYLSGVDIIASDKLGRLNVSREGCKERDRFVLENCKENDIPVAISMGGGYSPNIIDIIEAHANTFRLAQEIWF
jgi:acetoin utilization deacetylase AcuC-like enzyme